MQTIYWLVIFVVLVLIELVTMGLTTIWFAGGAIVACLLGMVGASTAIQVGAFLIVSLILLVITRPIATKYFNKGRHKTNAESLIGQGAVVIEEIDTLKAVGRVLVNGMEWSAKTEDPTGQIAKDSAVVIEGIQGVKLIVKRKEDK